MQDSLTSGCACPNLRDMTVPRAPHMFHAVWGELVSATPTGCHESPPDVTCPSAEWCHPGYLFPPPLESSTPVYAKVMDNCRVCTGQLFLAL